MNNDDGEPYVAMCPGCKEPALGVPRDKTFNLHKETNYFLCFNCWFKYYAMGEKALRTWYKNKHLASQTKLKEKEEVDNDTDVE